MNVQSNPEAQNDADIAHFDVIIVGAGISGVDAAHHLRTQHPDRRFLIIDRADGIGGTWRTHRFPGIRSDSDLHTFAFEWKPWPGETLASGPEILDYLEEAVAEEGLAPHMRFNTGLTAADWSERAKRWTLRLDTEQGETRISCDFLWMCQGYYDHQKGYAPEFPGQNRFGGPIVHPQHWPDGLEISGKRIAIIGSGATAATLAPALAADAGHVSIVQRSPTYFYPKPRQHELAATLKALDLPPEWVHEIMRRQILKEQAEMTRRCVDEPDAVREELLDAARAYLGEDFPLDPHFSPRYRVWRQRLAVVPEGDMFHGIRRGDISMVTGDIHTLTETGVEMADGTLVEADVIISATGLNLQMMGGAEITLDGRAHDFSTSWTHRGMLFTDVPNLAWTFGYIRASWTLRAGLVSGFVCRLLAHMDAKGAKVAEPKIRPEDADMPALPFFDPENFNPGYITRALPILPRGGDRAPWIFSQDVTEESVSIPAADLDDGSIVYR